MEKALWFDQFYLENFGFILAFLVALGTPLFLLRDKKTQLQASWASVKSWIFALPFLFFFIGLPAPYPYVFLCLVSIYSVKRFFQMVGAYHQSLFVYLTYFAIATSALSLHYGKDLLFLVSPIGLLMLLCLVPLFFNTSKNMMQYISLALIGFCLLGWNLLTAQKMLVLDQGIYLLLYLYALSEFSINTTNGLSLFIPAPLVVNRVSTKSKWSGFIISFALTVFIAWAFRRLLFDTSETYWLAAGVICFLGAHFGEWCLSAFRKDIGIKDQGVFIIGRGDLLSRTNKIMFSYPLFAFYLWYLKDISLSLN